MEKRARVSAQKDLMLWGIVGKGDPVKSIFSYHVKSIRFMEEPLVHTLEPNGNVCGLKSFAHTNV